MIFNNNSTRGHTGSLLVYTMLHSFEGIFLLTGALRFYKSTIYASRRLPVSAADHPEVGATVSGSGWGVRKSNVRLMTFEEVASRDYCSYTATHHIHVQVVSVPMCSSICVHACEGTSVQYRKSHEPNTHVVIATPSTFSEPRLFSWYCQCRPKSFHSSWTWKQVAYISPIQ